MRLERTRLFAGLLVGAVCVCAPACAPSDDRPERIIAYINDDNAAGRGLREKLDSALERQLSNRYRVRLRHVVVTSWDSEHVRDAMVAALRMHPAVIIATNSEMATIAKSVARDVPVIFGSRQDPIRLGLVESLARPGGNITGFTYFVPIEQKRLELLRQLSPDAKKLGILID